MWSPRRTPPRAVQGVGGGGRVDSRPGAPRLIAVTEARTLRLCRHLIRLRALGVIDDQHVALAWDGRKASASCSLSIVIRLAPCAGVPNTVLGAMPRLSSGGTSSPM